MPDEHWKSSAGRFTRSSSCGSTGSHRKCHVATTTTSASASCLSRMDSIGSAMLPLTHHLPPTTYWRGFALIVQWKRGGGKVQKGLAFCRKNKLTWSMTSGKLMSTGTNPHWFEAEHDPDKEQREDGMRADGMWGDDDRTPKNRPGFSGSLSEVRWRKPSPDYHRESIRELQDFPAIYLFVSVENSLFPLSPTHSP